MAAENYTLYTESDVAGNRISIDSATQITITSFTRNTDDNVYVYDDFGVNFFDGDIDADVDQMITGKTGVGHVYSVMFANAIDEANGLDNASADFQGVALNTAYQFFIRECDGGTLYTDATLAQSEDTQYYLTLVRDDAGATLTCYIFDDAARTNLLDTLSLALHNARDFRYCYAVNTFKDALAGTWSGVINNLNLNLPATAAAPLIGGSLTTGSMLIGGRLTA